METKHEIRCMLNKKHGMCTKYIKPFGKCAKKKFHFCSVVKEFCWKIDSLRQIFF